MIAWHDLEVPALPPAADLLRHLQQAGDRAADRVAERLAAQAPPLVVLDLEAANQAWRSVAGSPLERGGLLLGQAYGTGAPGAGAVHVRAAVASVQHEASAVSLRMEAALWSAARLQLRPGERVVGWYHSHPGIGAFFSATDRQTQAAFFREDYSLGWVIDPVRQTQAWFVGARAQPLDAGAVIVAGMPR